MDRFMAMAIEEAQATKARGRQPFWRRARAQWRSHRPRGRNLMIQNNDPLSHGEMEAIKAAGLQAILCRHRALYQRLPLL